MPAQEPDWQRWFSQSIPAQQFDVVRREPHLRLDTYDKRFKDKLGGLLSVTEHLARAAPQSKPRAAMMALQQRLWDVLDWTSMQYSAGAAINELAGVWPFTLRWAIEYADLHELYHASPEAQNRVTPHATLRDEEYWIVALRMVCFGILSDGARDMPRVMAFLDYGNADMGVRDGLIERLVAPFVGDRGALPDRTTRGLPYRKLLPLFDAAPQDRPAMMGRYLQDWYRDSRREPYFNQHGEADVSFYGYWSWEAAAATVVLGIDDGAYCDMPCYPKDWVDHALAGDNAA